MRLARDCVTYAIASQSPWGTFNNGATCSRGLVRTARHDRVLDLTED